MPHKHVSLTTILIIFVVVALFPGGLHYHMDLLRSVEGFYLWLQNQGAWAPFIFILVNIVVVVFLLPGLIITFGAGLLFGFARGVPLVLIGTTLGALVAFNIARYFFGERITRYLAKHPKIKTLNDEFVHEGYVFILLTRLVPFFPFKLSNYFFGLARFSQTHFLVGTVIGIIPITCINVYLGSIAADVGMLVMGKTQDFTASWWVYILGFIVTVIALFYIRAHAHRALMRYSKSHPTVS